MNRSLRAVTASLALIVVSAVVGGVMGRNAQAAPDASAAHLKRYSEILSAIESNYVELIEQLPVDIYLSIS